MMYPLHIYKLPRWPPFSPVTFGPYPLLFLRVHQACSSHLSPLTFGDQQQYLSYHTITSSVLAHQVSPLFPISLTPLYLSPPLQLNCHALSPSPPSVDSTSNLIDFDLIWVTKSITLLSPLPLTYELTWCRSSDYYSTNCGA